MRGEWDASVKANIQKLRQMDPLKEPFEIASGCSVVDPAKFHGALLAEADYGPKSPRSVTGAFQGDLKAYLAIRGEGKELASP